LFVCLFCLSIEAVHASQTSPELTNCFILLINEVSSSQNKRIAVIHCLDNVYDVMRTLSLTVNKFNRFLNESINSNLPPPSTPPPATQLEVACRSRILAVRDAHLKFLWSTSKRPIAERICLLRDCFVLHSLDLKTEAVFLS
jgi:hypothetical protein